MKRDEMIEQIKKVYPGDKFAEKMAAMPDKQLHSMYTRLLSTGAFNKRRNK